MADTVIGDFLGNLFKGTVDAVKGAGDALDPRKNSIAQSVQNISDALSTAAESMFGFVKPFADLQAETAQLVKAIGLSSKSIMGMSTRLIAQNSEMRLSQQYGVTDRQIMQLQQGVMSRLQRNAQIDIKGTAVAGDSNFDSTAENLIAASTVFGESNVAEIVSKYDKLGISMKTAAKATGKLYSEASKYGINLQKYTENFVGNLEMAQNYNFRNGVNGLKEMARKATEIRQDMKQIASFADKVGSVTGAVETAANLQVLGGSFASMANPLAMLNESLTDMNSLQDRFNEMTNGAATYNSVTHQIEMDPLTRMQIKRAAEAMGVDASGMIDQAYAQARRGEIGAQLNYVGNIDDDMRNLLKNVGEIDSETGVAGATIGGEFKTLAEIANSPDLQKELIDETRSESEDIKVIAKGVMTMTDLVKGIAGQVENENMKGMITVNENTKASNYDTVLNFLKEGISPEAINSFSKISNAVRDFTVGMSDLANGIVIEVGQAVSTMGQGEKHAKAWGEAFENIFGNVFGEDAAKELGEKLGGYASSFFKGVEDEFKKYDYSPFFRFTGESEYNGEEGRPPLTENDNPRAIASSVALAANDVAIQASSISLNGGSGVPFSPLSATGEYNRAGAAMRIEGEIERITTQNEPIPVIIQKGEENKPSAAIEKSEESIPTATVYPDKTSQKSAGTSYAEEQQARTKTGQGKEDLYNINLTGTLTVNFNGDDGIVSSEDFMKLLDKSPTFKKELAKAIAEAIKEIDHNR